MGPIGQHPLFLGQLVLLRRHHVYVGRARLLRVQMVHDRQRGGLWHHRCKVVDRCLDCQLVVMTHKSRVDFESLSFKLTPVKA